MKQLQLDGNMRILQILAIAGALCVAIHGVTLRADTVRAEWRDLDDVLTSGNLKPRGTYYEATVPETLDLAERARLSVHGLTSFLNPSQNYSPYHQGWFNVAAPLMTSRMSFRQSDNPGVANWGKIGAALILTRHMSGSQENLDIDVKTLKGMVDYVPESPREHGWNPTTFVILALMDLHQRVPSPKIVNLIGRLVKAYHTGAERVGDDGQYGYGAHVRTQGDSIRMLTRWHEISGDRESLKLAGKVVGYVVGKREFWSPEAESKAVVSLDHAHFSGPPHEYAHCLMGILCYAQATNDARLKQFVRDGYEYLRNFGIARLARSPRIRRSIAAISTGRRRPWSN
jgi:hypothetical protein